MPPDYIREAQQTLASGEGNLTQVLPAYVSRIIEDELWKDREKPDGSSFATFVEFCEHKLWWGLECPFERMQTYCDHDTNCRLLLLNVQGQLRPERLRGDSPKASGNNITTKRGTDPTYTYRRLLRDAPELAAQVALGKMTANSAAIAAGIKPRTINVPLDVAKVARAIRKHFDAAQIDALVQLITQPSGDQAGNEEPGAAITL